MTTNDGAGAPVAKKRRKSRWESAPEPGDAVEGEAGSRELLAVSAGGFSTEVPAAEATPTTALMTAPVNTLVIGAGIFVQLPTSVLTEYNAPSSASPEVHFLFRELAEMNRRLIAGAPFDENAANEPKPAPVYDSAGVRVNTREVVEREKYTYRRMELLEEICKKCPAFRPPPDYRPNKRTAKLLIPVDEYPGYNFFGLIIGPRGSTQKQMQRDTNTKIVIRGRGSAKGGTGAAERNNEFEHEPLHVLIEGDTQADVDKARGMIEKLLIPVDEDMNEHKRAQLKELALMNGTWRDESSIEAMQKRLDEEMASGGVYKLPEEVKRAVDATYRKDVERLHGAGNGGSLDNAYSDFLSELGVDGKGRTSKRDADDDRKIYVGHLAPSTTAELLDEKFKAHGKIEDVACIPDPVTGASCKGFAFITYTSPSEAKAAAEALNGTLLENRVIEVRVKSAPREEVKAQDTYNPDANLYVGGITDDMNEETLRELFTPYGLVEKVKVLRDHATNMNKGFGFVQMMDPSHAHAAIAALDGHMFRDSVRPFMVRIAGQHNAPQQQNSGFGGYGGYGGFPNVSAAYPPMMMMPQMVDPAYYAGGYAVDPAAYGGGVQPPNIELGNPDDAPPPPPEEDGAPPPMVVVADDNVVTAEQVAVLPGVAPPAPPPMPPPPP